MGMLKYLPLLIAPTKAGDPRSSTYTTHLYYTTYSFYDYISCYLFYQYSTILYWIFKSLTNEKDLNYKVLDLDKGVPPSDLV